MTELVIGDYHIDNECGDFSEKEMAELKIVKDFCDKYIYNKISDFKTEKTRSRYFGLVGIDIIDYPNANGKVSGVGDTYLFTDDLIIQISPNRKNYIVKCLEIEFKQIPEYIKRISSLKI